MKLLLLGGPRFLGRAIVDAALERGHELTVFNRTRATADACSETRPAPRAAGDHEAPP